MTANYEFVDTNLLLYSFDPTVVLKHTVSVAILKSIWERNTGCISIQVLQEFYVNSTRKLSPPMSLSNAKKIVERYSTWQVHVPTAQDIVKAIDLQQRSQASFWDAMIIQSASSLRCTTLWSEDLNHGQKYLGVEVKNPFLS